MMGSGSQKFPYVELSVILLKFRYAECCYAECVTASGIVFTALHFLRNLRISPISWSVTLHLAKSPANNKHASLLVQCVSYEENKVL